MNFHVLTLFPEMILQGLNTSIIGRAMAKGIITLEAVNIRDYTIDKHKKVDDYPYGGGAGMLMQAQPVYDAYRAVVEEIYSEYNEIYIFFKRILRLPDSEAKEQTLLFINTFPKSTGERLSEVVKKSLNKKNNKE